MFRFLTPKTIKPPFARYSHGVEVPAGKRLVLCSGQLGIGPDDAIPEDAGAQAELCFGNIAAILGEAGLTLKDIVRINAFVTDRVYLRPYMDVRDRLFSDPAPASTLMIVSGFARPEFKVEIEVIAAG
ncbi:RidA family protein [Mesorhizobium sp. YR577]|uniref:RidA family protein n=1 Tax=Mesorhizobium sp. YR577 TaxID=1884373 RepID=UPI0008E3DCCE|nr:RidA family protein [Mesorhizobium sp. YR577]SFU04378.1 Enamine deaminase RidA, house cleaning of reactive enamine intermediates, YjgF/YER057c/UK114 family [Mesorhizobium sp. YR577]